MCVCVCVRTSVCVSQSRAGVHNNDVQNVGGGGGEDVGSRYACLLFPWLANRGKHQGITTSIT